MKFTKLTMKNIFIKSFQLIFVITVTILTFKMSYNKPYKVIALLPLSYMVINIFYYNKTVNSTYNGGFLYKITLIVIFIRYVITPFSIAITGKFYTSYNGYNIYTSKESINLGITLMIFELICVYLTLYIARIYYSKSFNNITSNKMDNIRHKFILIIFILVAVIILLMVEPKLLVPDSLLVLSKDFRQVQIDIEYGGMYLILAQITKPIIFLILFSKLKEKYDLNNKKIYILLSYILIILFMAMYTGTRRWEILFAGIIGLYLLKKSYGRISKILMLNIIIIGLISIISISLYKFSWMIQNSTNPIKDIVIEMFGMFDDYFSGPRSVANSIEMEKVYGRYISISTFINDFVGSIPGISKFVNQTDRINVYFNMYHNRTYGNTSLIIPMIGIGYSYFRIFPPIFTVICYWFLIKFDYNLEKSNTLDYKYLYLYSGLYLSMGLGFNTQIIFTTFVQRYLPFLLLFKLNDKLTMTKKFKLVPISKRI